MQGAHETLETLRPVMDEFLKHFRDTGNIRYSCERANVLRLQVWRWRKKYKEFADRFESARKDAVDVLAIEARRRALNRDAPSDRLLMFLLQAHEPETYVPRQRQEITGANGGPVGVQVKGYVGISPDDWDDEPQTP